MPLEVRCLSSLASRNSSRLCVGRLCAVAGESGQWRFESSKCLELLGRYKQRLQTDAKTEHAPYAVVGVTVADLWAPPHESFVFGEAWQQEKLGLLLLSQI